MNMKKTLAGILAGAVAVSAMATMAMAADAAYTIDFGAANQVTTYNYDATATGAFYLPVGDVQFTIANPGDSWGWCNNGDWSKVTVSVEGYTADGKSTTAATYSVGDAGLAWNNGEVITIPVTNSKYGTGLNVTNFEAYADGVIVTKISITGASLAVHAGYDANGAQKPASGMPAAADAKTTLTSAQVKTYVPTGASGAELGATLEVKDIAAKSSAPKVEASAEGLTTFDISALALKNSQKRIIKEGATAAITITFAKIENDTTVLKYEINDKADVKLLPKGAESITFQLTNDMLYKAAASEDDVEACMGKVEILEGVTVKTAKVTVTPAGAAADDEGTTTPDAGEDTTTPDAGEDTTTPDAGDDANPPMGVAPVALAVLPVALAAAVVAKKRS
jgi:hypothetical protein